MKSLTHSCTVVTLKGSNGRKNSLGSHTGARPSRGWPSCSLDSAVVCGAPHLLGKTWGVEVWALDSGVPLELPEKSVPKVTEGQMGLRRRLKGRPHLDKSLSCAFKLHSGETPEVKVGVSTWGDIARDGSGVRQIGNRYAVRTPRNPDT